MALRESFQFSTDYITLIIEHMRTITRLLRNTVNITYNEYALLAVLLDTNERFQASDLGEYIGLKTRAITASLLKLEDLGYIDKKCDPCDRRVMLVGLREFSKEQVKELVNSVEERVRERFWSGLEIEEFLVFRSDIDSALDRLRGHAGPIIQSRLEHGTMIYPEFYIVWRLLQDVWDTVSRRVGKLPLRECRVLLLTRQIGAISPGDAADSLIIDKAGVTLAKERLSQKGLVVQNGLESDDRRLIFECTRSGASLADRLHAELRMVTEQMLGTGTGESLMLINAWSMMMYRNQRLKHIQGIGLPLHSI